MSAIKIYLLLILLPLSAILSEAQPTAIAITHVTVIDATGRVPQPDMTVIIQGERIRSVTPTGRTRIPSGAEVVDATGKFLIPGLWDMHVHLTSNPDQAVSRELMLPLLIAYGVVGVRDMGGDWQRIQQLRQVISADSTSGPRIVAAGPFVDGPPPFADTVIAISTEAEARAAVRRLKSQGVDFVKVQAQLSPATWRAVLDEAVKQKMTVAGHAPEQISAFDIARSSQRTIEHISPILPGDAGIMLACSSEEAALRAELLAIKQDEQKPNADVAQLRQRQRALRQQMITTIDWKKADSLFALMKRNDVWSVPTQIWSKRFAMLSADDLVNETALPFLLLSTRTRMQQRREAYARTASPEAFAITRMIFEKSRDLVSAMHRARVPMLAGTDAMDGDVLPGLSLHQELELFVAAGMTPLEALQTATRNPAIYLGAAKTRGTIAAGKIADLVILDADPLQSISNTQKIHAVIVAGRLITPAQRAQMLASVKAFASQH